MRKWKERSIGGASSVQYVKACPRIDGIKAICIMQCMQVYYSNNFATDGTPNAFYFCLSHIPLFTFLVIINH